MSKSNVTPAEMSAADYTSSLFASMVIHALEMAMIWLGRAPNPQTGQQAFDLDAARYFVDQLEMIAVKTRGNLTQEEDQILREALMSVRLAFVQAVEKGGPSAADEAAAGEAAAQAAQQAATSAAAAPAAATTAPSAPADEESKKKFVKKY
jgi:hypothetical protein